MEQEIVAKIIELYQSGLSTHKVAKELNVSQSQVRRVLDRNNIKTRPKKTDDNIERIILGRYLSGESSEKIAIDLGINSSTVLRSVKRRGGKIRPPEEAHKIFQIKEDFLDKIDTQEKAYFLGFMYADGNVHKKDSSCKIELHEKDIDILIKIQNILYISSYPKIGTDREVYKYITIYSDRIKQKLIENGCIPNKTFSLKMPSLDSDLLCHFIRGLFDGDGCIAIDDSRVRVFITGSVDFMHEVSTLINNAINVQAAVRPYKSKPKSADLVISNKTDAVTFLNWIYQDASIYLNRKYEKYKGIVLAGHNNIGYGSSNIISYNGNKLTKTYILSLSDDERERAANYVFKFLRANGFPYEKYSEDQLEEDFQKLKSSSAKISEDIITGVGDGGTKIFRHYCPHYYDVKSKLPSMIEVYYSDDKLMRVIKNRMGITYKETFNITGNMIKQGIRNSRIGFAASVFKPSIAKAIYDNFAPENSVVLDISTGFGQRMLGAMASNNVAKYIGIDPWEKQISALTNMKNKFSFTNADLYQIGSEKFCPEELVNQIDFCFSSPPFFNKEIYCEDNNQAYHNGYDGFVQWWVDTIKNVHNLLKDDSLFVLNMDDKNFKIMMSFCNGMFELIDCKYVMYERRHLPKNSYDKFHILKKI